MQRAPKTPKIEEIEPHINKMMVLSSEEEMKITQRARELIEQDPEEKKFRKSNSGLQLGYSIMKAQDGNYWVMGNAKKHRVHKQDISLTRYAWPLNKNEDGSYFLGKRHILHMPRGLKNEDVARQLENKYSKTKKYQDPYTEYQIRKDNKAKDQTKLYVFTEDFDGPNLLDFIKNGNLNNIPLTERLDLYIGLLQQIDSAHKRGIVHRDIKPENIIIHTNKKGKIELKLIDWEFACHPGTHTGMTMGYLIPNLNRNYNNAEFADDICGAGIVGTLMLRPKPGDNYKGVAAEKVYFDPIFEKKHKAYESVKPPNVDGCDLHLMSKFPGSFAQYKNSYIYIKNNDTQELYYITPYGEFEKETINDFILFEKQINILKKQINALNKNKDDTKLHISEVNIKVLITLKGGCARDEYAEKVFNDAKTVCQISKEIFDSDTKLASRIENCFSEMTSNVSHSNNSAYTAETVINFILECRAEYILGKGENEHIVVPKTPEDTEPQFHINNIMVLSSEEEKQIIQRAKALIEQDSLEEKFRKSNKELQLDYSIIKTQEGNYWVMGNAKKHLVLKQDRSVTRYAWPLLKNNEASYDLGKRHILQMPKGLNNEDTAKQHEKKYSQTKKYQDPNTEYQLRKNLGDNKDKFKTYVFTENFDGPNLSDFIYSGKLNNISLPDRLDLYLGLLQQIDSAHRQGIVHRDIKPENIIVYTNKDGKIELKLIDWEFACQPGTNTGMTKGYLLPRINYQEAAFADDICAAGIVGTLMLRPKPGDHYTKQDAKNAYLNPIFRDKREGAEAEGSDHQGKPQLSFILKKAVCEISKEIFEGDPSWCNLLALKIENYFSTMTSSLSKSNNSADTVKAAMTFIIQSKEEYEQRIIADIKKLEKLQELKESYLDSVLPYTREPILREKIETLFSRQDITATEIIHRLQKAFQELPETTSSLPKGSQFFFEVNLKQAVAKMIEEFYKAYPEPDLGKRQNEEKHTPGSISKFS